MHISYYCSATYQAKVEAILHKWNSQEVYFDIHTSGSTGKPKLIRLKRSLMQKSAEMTGKYFGLTAGNTAFCCLNVEYIAGLMMLVRASVLDLDLVVVEPTANPLDGIDLNNESVFYAFVPLQLETIWNEHADKLSNAKAVIVGGAAVSPSLLGKIKQSKIPIFATYGMTETITHIAVKRLSRGGGEFFEPLAGVDLATDHRECLMIKADLTEEQWITTNDVVNLTEKGFELLGRFDNVINSGGVKIQAEKIEKNIGSVLNQQRFFVAGLPDEKLGQKLCVFIEGAENKNIENTLHQYLCGILSKYEIPKAYYFVLNFEETPSNKINKNATVERWSITK